MYSIIPVLEACDNSVYNGVNLSGDHA